MRIGSKLLPYPVLNKEREYSSYKNSFYELHYDEPIVEKGEVVFKGVYVELNNDRIKSFLEKGKAQAKIIIECSYSLFRKSYDVGFEPCEIKINVNELNNKFVISSYIVCLEDLSNFCDEDLTDDYEGFEFILEKYSILSVDDGEEFMIDEIEEVSTTTESIFSVIQDNNEDSISLHYEVDNKIDIYLPRDTFDIYNSMKDNQQLMNLFFAIIGIPALTYAIHDVKEKVDSDDELEEYTMDHKWMLSVRNAYKKLFNCDFNYECLTNIDEVRIQQLLNNGYIEGIKEIQQFDSNGTEGEEDE